MTKIDITKPVKCRDGRQAEVFCEKDGNLWGRVKDLRDNFWGSMKWDLNGDCNFQELCLLQEPEKKTIEFWVNVLSNGTISPWTFLNENDAHAVGRDKGYIACLKITREYQVGEGI